MQSLKFKKIHNFKPISLVIAMIFLSNNMAYGIDISGKSYLRTPLIGSSIIKDEDRLEDGLTEILNLKGIEGISFTICKRGERVLGQDEKVIGYAGGLLLTNEEKALMQKKGIFIYDIDKTLAGRNKPLLEQTIQTIEKLMRSGHLVVIITGQPIDIQRERIIDPIDPKLRRNLVVITNEGTSVHHFLKDGREYVIKNDFTNKFAFTEEQSGIMKKVVDEFIEENGFEYAPGGEFEPREMTQAAFKIEATLETRTQYAAQQEKELKERGIWGFRGWASGTSTISFLHEDADKRKAGLGFLKEQGFKLNNAVYHGDEFFPGGNDYCIKEDNDISIAVVGRYDKAMEERKDEKVLLIGGGPYATTRFADDFIAEERFLGEGANFHDVMVNVAARNINIETVFYNLQKGRTPKEALEYLTYKRLPEGSELRNLLDKALKSSVNAEHKDFMKRIDAQKLTDFIHIARNYRVGPVFINSLYEQMFGNSLEKDFVLISELIEGRLLKEKPLDFSIASRENFLLRDLLAGYGELFTILLGETASNLTKATEKLTRQDQIWRYNKTEREQVIRTIKSEIPRVEEALGLFFEENGVFRWLLTAFGNNLSDFYKHVNIESLAKPVLDVRDEISDKDLDELTSGLVALSGGGGAKFLSTVMLEAKVHNFALPSSENMPFIMIVPAEDDGGATAIVCYIGEHSYYFKFPAMGDSMNAYSGLSSGERDELGDSKFPYFYDVARERFPLEGIDPLMDEFSQIASSVIQAMVSNKSVTSRDWEKAIYFFRSMFKVLDKFDLIPVEGQSMGNLIWTASADKLVEIAKSKGNPSGLKELTEDQIVSIQRFLAKTFGLDNMMVIPSNLNPGTIYGFLENLVVESDGKMDLIDRKELARQKVINIDGKQLIIREEIEDIVDEENGHTYIDYDLKDGEEIFISHRNKEIPLAGSAMFRAHVKKENGKLSVRFNIGAEPWGDWHALGDSAEVIGIPNGYIKGKAPDQLKWGARVCGVEGGGVLRIYGDRVGAGTTLRFNDGKKVMIKTRIIAKQTNITESYHLSKIYKVGFTGKEKPKANPFILKALRNSKVGCVIGPGSPKTSIETIQLLPEVREELRNMAKRGLPVIRVWNPYKDNESAYESISEGIEIDEESCGEPIYGLERGGFVTDMIVNNVETMPDESRKLMTEPDPKKTQLRPAERPRGEFSLTSTEKIKLRGRLGKNFGIHRVSMATVILKEVRGGIPEKGIGYDFRLFGRALESIITSRMSDQVKESILYKDVLAIFNGKDSDLTKAVEYLRRVKGYWSETEVLQKIRDLFNTKGALTREVLGKLAPKLLVLNMSHSILETDYIRNPEMGIPFTKEMKEAMVSYIKAGGRIVISTGLDFSVIRDYIFGGDNAIEKEFRDSIYFITLSGAELRKGEDLLPKDFEPVPEKARDIINRVLKVYGLDGQQGMFNDYGAFINLKLHAFTSLSQNEVEELNAEIFRNTSLNLKAHERRIFAIEWTPGLAGTYDLRGAIVGHIQRLFDEAGINLTVETSGSRGSIDIGNISEVRAFKELADITENFDGIAERDMLFIPSGGTLSQNSEAFPNAMYLTLPVQDPSSIFISNSIVYQLSGERNPVWNMEECRTLFEMAAAALLKAQSLSGKIDRSRDNMKIISDSI